MDVVTCDKCGKQFDNQTSFEQHSAAKHKYEEIAQSTNKSSKKPWIIGGLVVIGVTLFVFIGSGGFNDSPSEKQTVSVAFAAEKVLGNESAPVTLVEYSDFQCPFCGRFFRETEAQIIQQYVDTGKVKFVYKHYPVDAIHPEATKAAVASECANEQGSFWEFHDILFSNQHLLGESSYKSWAQQLNLDSAQFNECYDSNKYRSITKSDFQEGRNAGVRGTPGFTVNGRLVSGAQPFSVFQRLIEEQLP